MEGSAHGVLLPRELPDVAAASLCKVCKAFFNTAFSRANCPQKRSNSALRASSGLASLVPALAVKAASPRSLYSRRQRARTLAASPCSRQIWAGRFSPLDNWRTMARLNSRVKVRPGMSQLAFFRGRRIP